MERACLLTLVKEMQANTYKNYFNIAGKSKQSSVALVMRVKPSYERSKQLNEELFKQVRPFIMPTPQDNLIKFTEIHSILQNHSDAQFQGVFIQRALDPKDVHSGQLAFPGGHVDNDENDFESAVREVREEIGLELTNQTLYLGKLPKNFYARKTRLGEQLYTSMHFFLFTSEQAQFVLQEKEVKDAQWIDMDVFFNIKRDRIQIYKFKGPFNLNVVPKFLQRPAKNASHHFKYGEFCSIDIGMNNVLWGLTFYFMTYVLSLIRANFIGDDSQSAALRNIDYLMDQSSHYNLVFDDSYSFGNILNFFTKRVHHSQRFEQFRYQSSSELNAIYKKKCLLVSFAAVFAASIVAYPFLRSSL